MKDIPRTTKLEVIKESIIQPLNYTPNLLAQRFSGLTSQDICDILNEKIEYTSEEAAWMLEGVSE